MSDVMRALEAIDREVEEERLARMRRAGDELAAMLAQAPGIDPFRRLALEEWRSAR